MYGDVVERSLPVLRDRGRRTEVLLHDGGHVEAPNALCDRAIRWLAGDRINRNR